MAPKFRISFTVGNAFERGLASPMKECCHETWFSAAYDDPKELVPSTCPGCEFIRGFVLGVKAQEREQQIAEAEEPTLLAELPRSIHGAIALCVPAHKLELRDAVAWLAAQERIGTDFGIVTEIREETDDDGRPCITYKVDGQPDSFSREELREVLKNRREKVRKDAEKWAPMDARLRALVQKQR